MKDNGEATRKPRSAKDSDPEVQEKARRPVQMKAYQVLKLIPGVGPIKEVVLAHIMQHCEPATAQFIDIDIDPEFGMFSRIHRVIFNCEDIQEVPLPEAQSGLIH